MDRPSLVVIFEQLPAPRVARTRRHELADILMIVLLGTIWGCKGWDEMCELELAALEAERQAANAEGALVQLDVKTDMEQRLHESSLAGLAWDLTDAQRHAAAAERLATEGLMSALDHGDARDRAAGLASRVAAEQERKRALLAGRSRQLSAQRAEVERLREIAKFRRQQLAALDVRAGKDGIVVALERAVETGGFARCPQQGE